MQPHFLEPAHLKLIPISHHRPIPAAADSSRESLLAIADYCRSFARPAAWLVSNGFFIYGFMGWTLPAFLPPSWPDKGGKAQ
jgi:hypothetical protein